MRVCVRACVRVNVECARMNDTCLRVRVERSHAHTYNFAVALIDNLDLRGRFAHRCEARKVPAGCLPIGRRPLQPNRRKA